jgi:Gpi18-like mannosyltransferase
VVAYLAGLALPAVWLNSAYWAQCDMLYAALCLGMLYHLLKKQGGAATALWALALCVKLQAVFALPVLLIGLASRRIRLRALVWAPAVFALCLVPALLGGQTLANCLQIYADQAELYPQMHLNAPSIWVLLGHVEVEPFGKAALFLAGCAVLVFIYLCRYWRAGLTDDLLPLAFYAAVLLLPFMLPHMHDRYFFLADLAAVLVFLHDRRRWPLPVITVLASYSCYRAFLMYQNPVLDMKWHAISLLGVLAWALYTLFTKMHAEASRTQAAQPDTDTV